MIQLYIVRMKRVTASQARRNWFRLLDEVAAGEVVVIERKGRRIALRREEEPSGERAVPLPDYSSLLRAEDADRADRWGWRWEEGSGELAPADAPPGRAAGPADTRERSGHGDALETSGDQSDEAGS